MVSDVPQALVFDPLLIIIRISDIDAHLQNTIVRSFADDMRLIIKIGNESDCSREQEQVENILIGEKEITLLSTVNNLNS